jgi:hypothetical protein
MGICPFNSVRRHIPIPREIVNNESLGVVVCCNNPTPPCCVVDVDSVAVVVECGGGGGGGDDGDGVWYKNSNTSGSIIIIILWYGLFRGFEIPLLSFSTATSVKDIPVRNVFVFGSVQNIVCLFGIHEGLSTGLSIFLVVVVVVVIDSFDVDAAEV